MSWAFCYRPIQVFRDFHTLISFSKGESYFAGDESKPLHNAITSLMQLMTGVVEGGVITPQLAFIGYFIQALVETTSVKTASVMKPLLSLVPPALVKPLDTRIHS